MAMKDIDLAKPLEVFLEKNQSSKEGAQASTDDSFTFETGNLRIYTHAPLTHSFIHSLIHLLTYLLAYSLTHSQEIFSSLMM